MDKDKRVSNCISEELKRLPYGFDNLSNDFRVLIAVLRLHNFSILRADEAKESIAEGDDLWTEISSPSIWIYAQSVSELAESLRKRFEEHDTSEYRAHRNKIIKAHLFEQRRLLTLLEKFYENRSTPFHARLVIETLSDYDAASCLKPQGSDIRFISSASIQQEWFTAQRAEMIAFAKFLADRLPPSIPSVS